MRIRGWSILLLLAVWGTVLLVPDFRNLLRVQLTGGNNSFYPHYIFYKPLSLTKSRREIAALYPNDLSVQQLLIEQEDLPGFSMDELAPLSSYDELIQKFPKDPALLACRITKTIQAFRTDRVGGELSDAKSPQNFLAGLPSPERAKGVKPNFSAEDLRKVIALCEKGRRLEPDNAFYDWALVNFYSISWQDDKVRLALAQGARKSHYNDHRLENQQNKIEGLQRIWGRPLLWDEKCEILFMTVDFARNARYRELTRTLVWSGVKARRQGNNAQALQIWGDTAHVARLMRLHGPSYTDGLVASALEAISYAYVLKDPKISSTAPGNKEKKPRALQRFVALAIKNGRPDLAKQALASQRESDAYLKQVRAQLLPASTYWFGSTSEEDFNNADHLKKSGVLLLLPIIGALPLLVCGYLLSWWSALRRFLLLDTTVTLSRRDILHATVHWLGFSALVNLLFFGAVTFASFAAIIYAAGAWESVCPQVVGIFTEFHMPEPIALWPVAFAFPLLCLSHALSRVISLPIPLPEESDTNNKGVRTRLKALLPPNLTLPALASWGFFRVISAFFTASCITLVASPYLNFEGSPQWLFYAIVFFGCTLFIGHILKLYRSSQRRIRLRYACYLTGAGAWYGLVIANVLYLTILMISWPLNSKINHDLDLLIRYGEVKTNNMK